MSKNLKMDLMQSIRKANKEQEIFEDFELELYGENFQLRLAMPDIFDILDEQKIAKTKAFVKYRDAGLDQYEPDWSKWKKQLEELKDKDAIEAFERNRPSTLADQEAEESSRFATIKTLLPKIIRYTETGELLCKNIEAQQQVGRYIANNPLALRVITEAWAKIMSRYGSLQESVKNSSKESKDQNSDSE